MRTLLHFLVLALCWGGPSAFAETLVLKSGSTIDGTIIGTNESHYVLLTDFAVYSFAKTSLREIKQQVTPITETKRSGRLPDFRSTVLALIKQSWGANVKQIPATVIDKGVLRNVPYVSLRCSDDYEVNIYGDVNDPAGIEAGVYRTLLNDGKAKMNCLEFLANLLSEPPDKDIVLSLNRAKDVKEREGFKFEVTSSDAEDAYGGWWVSVYSEKKLNRSRASETEMTQITVSKTTPVEDGSSWTANEMKLARTPLPLIITVSSSDGQLVTNAEVVRVVDGAYVVWRRQDASTVMGMTRLEELSEATRTRLGFDPAKASAAYAAEENRKSLAQAATAAQPAPVVSRAANSDDSQYYNSYSSSPNSSGGGSVYVRGYTRKDGTYVRSYTRSAPRR